MLGKLIKLEFRATARLVFPCMIAVLALSLINNLSVRFIGDTDSSVLQAVGMLLLITYILSVFALFIVTVVFMVQRFRRSLLGDEGYLMWTLPVTVHSHIWAKLISAVVWIIAAGVTAMLSVFIVTFSLKYVDDLFKSVFDLVFHDGATALILHEALTALISIISGFLMLYAAFSLGHSFNRKKMLLSVVFFIAFYLVCQIIGSILLSAGILNLAVGYVGADIDAFMISAVHRQLWQGCAMAVVYSVVFYLVTAFSLKRRLNLQ